MQLTAHDSVLEMWAFAEQRGSLCFASSALILWRAQTRFRTDLSVWHHGRQRRIEAKYLGMNSYNIQGPHCIKGPLLKEIFSD